MPCLVGKDGHLSLGAAAKEAPRQKKVTKSASCREHAQEFASPETEKEEVRVGEAEKFVRVHARCPVQAQAAQGSLPKGDAANV